jgi:hypothetical protein
MVVNAYPQTTAVELLVAKSKEVDPALIAQGPLRLRSNGSTPLLGAVANDKQEDSSGSVIWQALALKS